MQCPSCQRENNKGANFCEACGTALSRICSNCQATLSAEARFCTACGQAVADVESEVPHADLNLGDENRHLSVLFCDLVGSTGLSREMDAEQYRDTIRDYHDTVTGIVESFHGHIDKYLGDGVLAFFGYPQAYDDDAERAVNAGYQIIHAIAALNGQRKERGEAELSVRIGIHSGQAVIGEVAKGQSTDVMAFGDTLNIAARLQEQAAPNSVVISQATMRLVPGLFITEDLGARELKGVQQPVAIYRVVQRSGVRSRLEAAVHLTRFVGRMAQLSPILEAWQSAVNGQGKTVLVSGDAGMGKSRLLHAFHERIADQPHTWFECRCSQLHQGTAFEPIVELMHRSLRIKEDEDPKTKLAHLERGISTVGGVVEEWVPLLAPLLGLDIPKGYTAPTIGGDLKRRRTVEILVAWLIALGRRQSLVVLVEDVHCADYSTLELMQKLAEAVPGSNLLLLVSSRPQTDYNLPHSKHVRHVHLPPLNAQEVYTMVESLSEAKMPEAVKQLICNRAGGVPLFVEELTKSVLESSALNKTGKAYELVGHVGDLESTIPASLHDLLMARLDMMGPARQLAHIGAVIGREFHHRLIAAVSGKSEAELLSALERLIDAELIYQRGTVPDAVYLFKHSLIQDVAYQSLLRQSRQELHSTIADELRKLLDARIISDPSQVAWHYEQAGRIEDAARYYQKAAELAETRSAIKEAYEQSRRAYDLLVSLPHTEKHRMQRIEIMASLVRGVISLKGYAHSEVGEITRMALGLARDANHSLFESLGLVGLCIHHVYRAEFQASENNAQSLIESSVQNEMPVFRLIGEYHLGVSHLYQGKFGQALASFERTIEQFTPMLNKASIQMTGHDLYANSIALKVWPAWLVGNTAEAVRMDNEAQQAAAESDLPITRCHVLSQTARLYQMQGDYQRMLQKSQEVLDMAQQHGIAQWAEVSRIGIGSALCGLGQHDRGLEPMREAIERIMDMGTRGLCPFYLGMLAAGYLSAGKLDVCKATLDQALSLANETGGHVWTAELLRLKGDCLMALGSERSEAVALWAQAQETAHQQQAVTLEERAASRVRRVDLSAIRK